MGGQLLISDIFALKKTRASGQNVGKVFNPVVKLVLENQPFLITDNVHGPNLFLFLTVFKLVVG